MLKKIVLIVFVFLFISSYAYNTEKVTIVNAKEKYGILLVKTDYNICYKVIIGKTYFLFRQNGKKIKNVGKVKILKFYNDKVAVRLINSNETETIKVGDFILSEYDVCNHYNANNDYDNDLSYYCLGMGMYRYNLDATDLAVSPTAKYIHELADFTLAYHRSPFQLLGFYASCSYEIGSIERGIWENFPDGALCFNYFIGLTYNPFSSNRLWFHVAGGQNILSIEGESNIHQTYETIHYYGLDNESNIWAHWMNGLSENGDGDVIKGYPRFKRKKYSMEIGTTINIIKYCQAYVNYTPVFAKPIRHDYKIGIIGCLPVKDDIIQ
jgi:hypothetical protein